MRHKAKSIVALLLALILTLSLVPISASEQSNEVKVLEAVGNLTETKFLWKYGMTGEVISANGEYVGTGSTFENKGETYKVLVYGDVNCDGKIQSSDYALIKRNFSGHLITGDAFKAADVNKDGRITSADHVALKKAVGGTYELWSPESYVGERFMGYRIWNFSISSLSSVKSITDAAKGVGFNAINLHIPWYQVEKEDGVYDYSAFDPMVDYIVNEAGMSCAIVLYMGRMDGDDKVLSQEDYSRDMNGNLSGGEGARTSITFASDKAVEKCVAFYEDAVKHFDDLYGGKIMLYLPSFSHYNETEYSCNGDFDHSEYMEEGFREFLKEKYETIENINAALGSSYNSFDEISSPSGYSKDDLGILWYQFRHIKLKNIIDKLADAQHNARPDTKICLQFGNVYDEAAILRTTYDFTDLCEKADAVWVDDGPGQPHIWTMDYLAANLDIEYGNEIDGPSQLNASEEAYEYQGMVSYEHGAKYVVCANWGFDTNFAGWSGMWKNISGTWLSDNTPEMKTASVSDPEFSVSAYEMFHLTGIRYASYYAPSGRPLVKRDLMSYTPGLKNTYNFAVDYNNEPWSCSGWRNTGNGKMMVMRLLSGRWCYSNSWIAPGVVYPVSNIDTDIHYTAPESGSMKVTFDFGLGRRDISKAGVKILLNGQQIYPSGNDFRIITATNPLADSFDISLNTGDKLTFRTTACGGTNVTVFNSIDVKMN